MNILDTSNPESIAAALEQYKAAATQLRLEAEQKKVVAVKQQTEGAPKWETPAHRDVDPFDEDYDVLMNAPSAKPVEPEKIPTPNADGEFATPADGALWMATVHHKRQLPLDGKVARLKEWDKNASADSEQIRKWAAEFPGCNFGSVADDGPIFEVDSAEVRNRFGQLFSQTLTVQSSELKGHRYYLPADIEHIAQNATKHGDFSLRKHNAYCVSPGSVHPQTGKQYRVVIDAPIVAPTPQEIAFWNSERIEKKASALTQQAQIPSGQRNSALVSIAGKLLDVGMTPEKVKQEIIEINQNRCEPPLSVNELEETIFRSIDKWSKKEDAITRQVTKPVLMGGNPIGQITAEIPTGRRIEFVRGDSIKPMRLKWLWKGRILADKLNVFSGEPDVGKGMTTVDLASRITRHTDFPDCKNELDGPKDVLFLSSEDDMEDTIVPRLIAAGADMRRIHFAQISENTTGTIEEGIVCLDRDLPAMEEMIKRYPDTVLIIPDPVIAFLGDADPNKDKDVRPIYSKMKAFAKRLNVGWLFVNHWNKNQNATSINRTSGAKTMVSAPRATWMFTKSPEDPTRYLMMKGKGNLSSNDVKTLAYRIMGVPFDFGDGRGDQDTVPKLVWDGQTDHTTEEVLQEANEPKLSRNKKAEEFLTRFLQDGAKLASEVYRAGDKESLSTDKLKRARYALEYVAEQIDGHWYWAKSEEDLAQVKTRIYSKVADVILDSKAA